MSNKMLLAPSTAASIAWWVWLLIVIVIILLVLLLWWLFRRDHKEETPADEQGHAREVQAPTTHEIPLATAEEVKAEPAVIPLAPDDLKIIEGIGPKIEKLLNEAGITTFAGLAETEVARLQQILLDAKLRIADPTTWPEQASLAAQGKMDELQALQDSLKGGRKA